jgi:tRNA-2-methylthio-N6-dimethylallyladenosine synthase
LVDAFWKIPKLVSHFHLPVQSGSDRVLKEMRRDYTASWFLERLAALRDARPEIAVTTDIIVGFPTETEDDFAQTLTLLERARFDSAYSFAFSPRPHTRAAKMEDNVSKDVKLARLYQVQERLNHIGLEINQKWIGRRVRGYVEGISRNDEMKWTARMSQNKLVHFEADVTPPQPRTYVDVQLTEARPSHFQGTLATSLSLSQSYGATAIPAHLGVPL